MTEYNPNYEFAGGSCSIQDLREVDRENLVLVKWVAPQREILRNKYLIISELWAREHLVRSIKAFSRTKPRRQKHPWLLKLCRNYLQIKVGLKKNPSNIQSPLTLSVFSLIIYPSHLQYILRLYSIRDFLFSAEMDFLMEALIMSKFQHPNIVHFIGVCFDKHPRWESLVSGVASHHLVVGSSFWSFWLGETLNPSSGSLAPNQ